MKSIAHAFDVIGFFGALALFLIFLARRRRFFEGETRGFLTLLVCLIFITYLTGGLSWLPALAPLEFVSDYTRVIAPVVFSLFFYALVRDSAVREIKDSESRQRMIMSQMPALTWTTDRNLRVLSATGLGFRAFGVEGADIVGKTLFELYGRDDPEFPPLKAHFKALRGTSGRYELGLGDVVVDVYMEPLQDDKGRTTGVIGLGVDISERKKSEREQARLAAILDATPDFVGYSDPQGRPLYLNRAGRRMIGIDEHADLSEYHLQQIFPQWALQRLIDSAAEIDQHDGIWRGETALIDRDGKELPVSQIVIAHDEGGQGGRYLSTIARDISESKRAERALQESEANLKAIFNNTQQAFLLLDTSLRVRTFNTMAEQWSQMVLGRDLEQGELAERLFSIFDLTPFREATSHALRGESVVHQSQIEVTGGRSFWFETNYNPVVTDDGQIVGISMSILDITKRKEAEEDLLREKSFSDSIIDSLPAIFYLIDERANFLRFNDHLLSVSGYSGAEVRKKSAYDFFEGDDLRIIAQAIQRVLSTGRANVEASLTTKDGRKVPTFFTGLRIQLRERTCILGVGLDLSDRKRAEQERQGLEEQLRQSQKMESIGQLAGGMAHDFNNLLVAINGYSEILLDKLPRESSLRDDVLQIHKAGERAALLTRQLLAFSRRQVLKPRVLDLNHVVSEMLKLLARLIGEHVTVETILAEDLGRIKADPGQLEQVIVNLAVNARDAMPDGGRLTIETSNTMLESGKEATRLGLEPGRYVRLRVSDTGIGMDAGTRMKIFEPFFTTKSKEKGTGLGLAMVYGIVKQSGGSVSVQSEPGRGTNFQILLPRVDEPVHEDEEHPAAAAPASVGHEVILVAEDDEAPRELTVDILRSIGYEVLEAVDAQQAMEVVRSRSEPIDLLITDVVMPGMNGPELARQLQTERPGTRVLFMSGYTDHQMILEGVLREDFPFLQKPFTPRILVDAVRRILDEAESGPQIAAPETAAPRQDDLAD